MWVEEISIDNIKCFERQSIRLGTPTRPHQVVIFLGENGSGKSTVLQAIALLLAGQEGASQLLKPIGWLKDPTQHGKLTLTMHQSPQSDPGEYGSEKMRRLRFRYTFYLTGENRQIINNQVFTEPVIVGDGKNKALTWLRGNAHLPKGEGWFGAGYGAFRRLTRRNRIVVPSLQQPLRYTNFLSQFVEDEPLEAFETWLVYLDYRIAKNNNDQLAHRQKAWGIHAINQLLPEGNQFHSIDANGNIWFEVDGTKVSTHSLSDGFRSIMALSGDLVWRLVEAFPNSSNPLHEEGVVLIDELDIHLHPTWQRQIATLLRHTFPNLQFIIATHSPLVAAGAGKDAITYRFFKTANAVSVEQVQNVHAFSVEKVLQSPAFGLVSAYSPETQAQLDRYYALNQKSKRTPPEEKELQTTLPFVEQALGYESSVSDFELQVNDFIKKHWQ